MDTELEKHYQALLYALRADALAIVGTHELIALLHREDHPLSEVRATRGSAARGPR